jgi:acyl carrier protein
MATINELSEVFREVLRQPELTLRPEMTAKDVRDWDSLHHVQLIVAVEKKFKVKFAMREVAELKNVGDLLRAVQSKASPV